jgi:ABC-type transport system involved in multi-copper enzyme maturation permease subunit
VSTATGLWGNAVLTRELQVRLRSWRWAGVATLYVCALAIVTLVILLQRYVPSPDTAPHLGVQIFDAVAVVQLLLISLITPFSLVGALNGERRRGTWDLLILTRLSPLGIAGGKLLAGVAFNLLLLVASLPFYGLAFIFGDVSPRQAVPVFAVFIATIVLLGAAALLLSALTSRALISVVGAVAVALLLTIGLFYWGLHVAAPDAPAPFGPGYDPSQFDYASPLVPPALIAPLFALLSALPDASGGSLLAGLGTIHHPFGVGVTAAVWQLYLPLVAFLSLILVICTARLVRPETPRQAWRRRV